jgi:hypothetical protein
MSRVGQNRVQQTSSLAEKNSVYSVHDRLHAHKCTIQVCSKIHVLGPIENGLDKRLRPNTY